MPDSRNHILWAGGGELNKIAPFMPSRVNVMYILRRMENNTHIWLCVWSIHSTSSRIVKGNEFLSAITVVKLRLWRGVLSEGSGRSGWKGGCALLGFKRGESISGGTLRIVCYRYSWSLVGDSMEYECKKEYHYTNTGSGDGNILLETISIEDTDGVGKHFTSASRNVL